MNQALVPDGFPRQPLQQRAKDRFERVVEGARELLLESGLSGFSIPELATRLGYSRATIYNFFPTPYTIFNELTRRYLTELEQMLYRGAQGLLQVSWQEGARGMVAFAAQFYNANPPLLYVTVLAASSIGLFFYGFVALAEKMIVRNRELSNEH